jgi:hypothetical protein
VDGIGGDLDGCSLLVVIYGGFSRAIAADVPSRTSLTMLALRIMADDLASVTLCIHLFLAGVGDRQRGRSSRLPL